MRGFARIYVVRIAELVLKIEKLSRIISARGSQDLRSSFPIMAPGKEDEQTSAYLTSADRQSHAKCRTNQSKLNNSILLFAM